MRNLSYEHTSIFIEKLKGLSNTYFDAKVKHIRNLPEKMPTNKQLFLTQVSHQAIACKMLKAQGKEVIN